MTKIRRETIPTDPGGELSSRSLQSGTRLEERDVIRQRHRPKHLSDAITSNEIASRARPNQPTDVEGVDADDPRLTGVSAHSQGDVCKDPETGEIFEDHTKGEV